MLPLLEDERTISQQSLGIGMMDTEHGCKPRNQTKTLATSDSDSSAGIVYSDKGRQGVEKRMHLSATSWDTNIGV